MISWPYLVCLLALIRLNGTSLLNRKQRIIVKGVLLCDGKPAKDVLIQLIDYDSGPNPDDLLDTKKTDANGQFTVDGTEEETTEIDPIVKIFHDCNDGLVNQPCQRYWKLKVPQSYIFPPNSTRKVFDIGVWNLELIMAKEGRDCIH